TRVEDGEGEHPVEAPRELGAVLEIQGQDDPAVAVVDEVVRSAQFSPQFRMIVDLAIEDTECPMLAAGMPPGIVPVGLIAPLDPRDRQAIRAERPVMRESSISDDTGGARLVVGPAREHQSRGAMPGPTCDRRSAE